MPPIIATDPAIEVIDAEAEAAAAEQARLDSIEKDKAYINRWKLRVEQGRKHVEEYRKTWARNRRIARGMPSGNEANWQVRANLIGAIIEILLAFLYAKDPDLSVRPSESSGRARDKAYREFSDTLEIVLARLLKDARFKASAKRWLRAAMTVGPGWLKAGMQTRTEKDPMVEKRLNDLRDNLATIGAVEDRIARGDSADEDADRAQIEAQKRALEANLERTIVEGATVDIIAAEDVIVAPECGEVENYLSAPWIALDLYKTKDAAAAITGWEGEDADLLKQANIYWQRPRRGEDDAGGWNMQQPVDGSQETPDGFVRFTEIWSLDDGNVYTFIDGIADRWARAPYVPRTGSRFYPVFLLGFHFIDGEMYPQSDVEQLEPLQTEYNTMRSNLALHRKRAIPATIFDATNITASDADKLANASTQEFIPMNPTRPGEPLQNSFAPKPYNQVDPGLYDTDLIRMEMEKISGAQEAMQGSVAVEKTATEAKIQDSGFGARIGARRDALESVMSEICEYLAQLALQTFDQADAIRYAGPAAVWIPMSTEEALGLFDIEIKAGSTGKPKANSDREAWGVLLPQITALVESITEAKLAGEDWRAAPHIAVLQETLKRMDDHVDIERFIPQIPPEVLQQMQQQKQLQQIAPLLGAITGGGEAAPAVQ